MFVYVLQEIKVIWCCEREVHDCCLKTCGVLYFNNVWWGNIPDANCSGVKKRGHCSVDVAPGSFVNVTFFYGFNRTVVV